MSYQFYQPAPDDPVARDDGLNFILLEKASPHCNWVMRRHPDDGLISVRKATHRELAHARARQHLRAGVAQLTGPNAASPDDACAHSHANKLGCPECGEEFSGDEVKP